MKKAIFTMSFISLLLLGGALTSCGNGNTGNSNSTGKSSKPLTSNSYHRMIQVNLPL